MIQIPKRGQGGVIIISGVYDTPYRKVIITDGDDVATDVTDYVMSISVTLRATDTLPYASIQLDNSNERYLDTFTSGDKIEIWMDYTDGNTTKVFRGKLDNIGFSLDNSGYTVSLDARCCPETADQLIVKTFNGKGASDAIKEIIDDYYSGVLTYTNVETDTTQITANYENVSGWSAIIEICKTADLDCFIDSDLDLNVFAENSKSNTDVSLAVGINVKSVGRYGLDFSSLKNKVTVYGKEDNNIIYLWSENDETSQSTYWRKDEVFSDTNLINMELMEQKAEVLLSQRTKLPTKGSINALGMELLNPGEKIECVIGGCGIHGSKRVQALTHNWNASGFTTNVDLEATSDSLAKLFKGIITSQQALKPYANLNDMKYGYTIQFNESPSICYHNDTKEVGGILQLKSGQATGIMTSKVLVLDSNVTQCEFRYYGNYPETLNDTYEVSNDGGDTFMTVTAGTLRTFTTTGNDIVIKINMSTQGSTVNPIYEGICLLLK